MTATITIWSNRTIATIGMLLLSSIFLINLANAQCDSTPSITIDQNEVEITPFGNTFCWIDIPYRIINPGPCDMDDFTMFFSVTTPEGTENIVNNVTGPLSPNTPYDGIIGFPSILLKNDIDDACFELADVVIMTMLSSLNPPTAITEEIDCPFGNGTITVCTNDPNIVCDESNCIPFICAGDVSAEVQTTEIIFTETTNDNCSIEIPYSLTNNGNCDIGIFNLEIEVNTALGTETISETISGIAAGATINDAAFFSSTIISTIDGACLDLSEINLIASIPMQGDIITTTVACPDGNGTIEVCSNNPLIVCDDSNCTPFTCDSNVSLNVDMNDLFINELPTGICELTIPFVGENLGDCDVSGFDILIMVSSPNGSQVFEISQAGPIAAGSNFTSTFNAESAILSSPGISCFDLSDIEVNIAISSTTPPTVITNTIDCPNGLGTIEVCANNPDIVCDESMCELILPLELVSLKGEVQEDIIKINWETAFEFDNDHFKVQHSIDGRSFETVAEIASKGDTQELTSYDYEHLNPQIGENYYRLISTDIDGHEELSKIITISLESKNTILSLAPNPASDYLSLNGIASFSESLKANIYTGDGQLRMELNINTGQNNQEFNVSSLPTGLYFITIREGSFIQNLKFIKL